MKLTSAFTRRSNTPTKLITLGDTMPRQLSLPNSSHTNGFTRDHGYDDAISCLNSLQTSGKVLEERRQQGKKSSGREAIQKPLEELGFSSGDFEKLNILHIAGTKGKGTTCAFIDGILNAHRHDTGTPSRVGLFTSPHTRRVTERIKINSEPIAEDLFAKHFFQVWNAVKGKGAGLGYFRFLTLLSFYVFREEGVDAAIYETGVGGDDDATNAVAKPVATGITTLGLDHVKTLGPELRDIAWHKAGIMKYQCPAFTVPQRDDALEVLKERAGERKTELILVDPDDALRDTNALSFHCEDMELAVKMVDEYLKRVPASGGYAHAVGKQILAGQRHVDLPGQFMGPRIGSVQWYFDGAHTLESVTAGGEWFGKRTSQTNSVRAIVFHIDPKKRDEEAVLRSLRESLKQAKAFPQHIMFCPPKAKCDILPKDLVNRYKVQDELSSRTMQCCKDIWDKMDENMEEKAESKTFECVEDVIEYANKLGTDDELQILVTGSFYLFGVFEHILVSRTR